MDPHRQQAPWCLSVNKMPGNRTALVVLVGITARRAQRRHLRSCFSAGGNLDIHLPYIPFALGLSFCRWWIASYLRRRVFDRGYIAIHFLNFIGGGYLFRALGQELEGQPIGRIVYVRSPIQEEIPRILAGRYGRVGLTLLGGRMMADLSTTWISQLPFPRAGGEKGLIVETGVSRLARSLGLERSRLPASAWAVETLLPGADDVLEVAASHDEIYDDEEVLAGVRTFIANGRFGRSGSRDAAVPPRLRHAT